MATREPFRPQEVLRSLDRGGVEFVVIGGLAGTVHGSARVTYDVDVMCAWTPDNLERLATVLRDLDARLSGKNVPADLPFQLDAEALRRGRNFTFRTRLGRLDVLGQPSGAPAFEEVRRRALVVELGETSIPVASLDDLIAMKRAAGRPKDRGDLLEYVELARRSESS